MATATARGGIRTAGAAVMASAAAKAERLVSIDVLRGVVMILMAIDHVRVYSGLPAGGPTAGIFFTRWVTHFCAPAFAFFAGTSAFLSGRRRTPKELSSHLFIRGAWLVLLELTLLRLAWTFNVDYAHYLLFGVIWMLGICMILLAALVRLRLSIAAIAVFGLLVMGAQDLVGLAGRALPFSLRPVLGPVWQFLYVGGVISAGEEGPALAVLYSIVPWIGVMAAGYAFGAILTREAERRRRLCLRIGLAATAVFVVLAIAAAWPQPTLFRVLGQRKYPASQLYLLMTLGPTIALLPFAERARGAIVDAIAVFGRVPFFYYLLHIPLIHLAAIVVSLIREGRVNPWLFGSHPMMPPPVPAGYMWSLPLLYLVFACVIALLYLPCRWFARVKAERTEPWLRFL